MHRILSLLAFVLAATLVVSPASLAATQASTDQALVGKWSGTFDGDASGAYAITFTLDAAKKLAGTIEVSPGGGDGYSCALKSIAFDGSKLAVIYEAPNGDPVEIHIDATVEGAALKGAWKVIEKGSTNVAQGGTLVASKGAATKG